MKTHILAVCLTFTQARNTSMRRATRENREQRHEEQKLDTVNRRAARDDEERRKQEQV